MKKKTIVVNFIGGPGVSKSTLAAHTFSRLKMKQVICENVTEFAKDLTWENNKVGLSNQLYLLGNQYFRIDRCARQVDVVLTDSPLILSAYYNPDPAIQTPLMDMLFALNDKYINLNFFVKRAKPYSPVGRNETEEESNKISEDLKDLLEEFNMPYTEIPGLLESSDIIIEQVMKALEERDKNLTTEK